MKAYCIILFIAVGFANCTNFEYSPNEIFDKRSLKNSNAINLKSLGTGDFDDTVKFALTGDTQLSSDELIKFYKKVNADPSLDFVVVAGDLSEFGTLKEMEWFHRSLSHLIIPYVAVIGNHDLTSKGGDAFRYMYGEFNYSFIYGGIKFICHDTNSREYNFNGQGPDIPWLKKELQAESNIKSFIAISHVPPNSADFDQMLFNEYTSMFAQTPGFLASFHAHNHRFELLNIDDSGIPYVVTNTLQNKEFLVVEIVNNKVSFERIYL
jgi:hypothetical protein